MPPGRNSSDKGGRDDRQRPLQEDTFRAWFWGSMILATLTHFAVLTLWPELSAQDLAIDSGSSWSWSFHPTW